jgi:hypothetical protein
MMTERSCIFFKLALIAALVTQVEAKVADSSSGGFTIKHTMEIEAPPAGAFNVFVEKIGAWWDPQHTYSGDSTNLSIDARPNGCFCEKIRSNAGIAHMTVLYVDAGRVIRLSGGLGPLQAYAVSAAMTVQFSEVANRTLVDFTYTVGGYVPQGLDKLAPVVDKVLVEQMGRFERFVKTGKPQ